MDARTVNICKIRNVIHQINRTPDKEYMIISTDGEEAFDKIQFMINS